MPKTSFGAKDIAQAAARIAAGFQKDEVILPIDLTKGKSDEILKAEFDAKQRKELAKKNEAMPGGQFPIRNVSDLHNAIKDVRRSNNPAKAKAWIKKRAHDLDVEHELPGSWEKATQDELNMFEGQEGKTKSDLIEKGGEGSKGGRVIGHTKSGKPVYSHEKAGSKKYKDFSAEDHQDAAVHHKKISKEYREDVMNAHDDKSANKAGKSEDHHKEMYRAHGDHAHILTKQADDLKDKESEQKRGRTQSSHEGRVVKFDGDETNDHKKDIKGVIHKQSDYDPDVFEVKHDGKVSHIHKDEFKKSVDLNSNDPIEKAFASLLGVTAEENPIDKAFNTILKCEMDDLKKSKKKKTAQPLDSEDEQVKKGDDDMDDDDGGDDMD